MDVQGDMVQDMYDAGRLAEINDYCRCDVLDTYFVFLRTRVLIGPAHAGRRAADHRRNEDTGWSRRPPRSPAYRHYLDHWGDWPNPWAAQV